MNETELDVVKKEENEPISYVLGKADAALILRNTDQESVTIEMAIPNIDPVPPYVVALFAITKRLSDPAFIQEQLDFIEAGIAQIEESKKQTSE